MNDRQKKIEIILKELKKHPEIINASVRCDSPYGIQQMLNVSHEEAINIKNVYCLLQEVLEDATSN